MQAAYRSSFRGLVGCRTPRTVIYLLSDCNQYIHRRNRVRVSGRVCRGVSESTSCRAANKQSDLLLCSNGKPASFFLSSNTVDSSVDLIEYSDQYMDGRNADVLVGTMHFMVARDINRAMCVSRRYFDIASSDVVWEKVCRAYWASKHQQHWPRLNMAARPRDRSWRQRYADAERDGRRNFFHSVEELSSLTFDFRFRFM